MDKGVRDVGQTNDNLLVEMMVVSVEERRQLMAEVFQDRVGGVKEVVAMTVE